MKIARLLIGLQLISFLLVAFFSYASASKAVARYATTTAYEQSIKDTLSAPAMEQKVSGFTPLEFAEYSTKLAKSGANSAAVLCMISLAGFLLSGIELLLLNNKNEDDLNTSLS